jgi:pepF/M3 family oligoendopeptidase
MNQSMTWDLDSVFSGGSASPKVREKLNHHKEQIKEFEKRVQSFDPQNNDADFSDFKNLLEIYVEIVKGLSEISTFATGLASADVKDTQALSLTNEITEITSQLRSIYAIFNKKIVAIPEKDWERLTATEPFSEISFVLQEERRDGKRLLSIEEEQLLNALGVDGFHGWSDHYDRLVQTIEVPFEQEDGTVDMLSAGQAQNQLESHPDTEVRHQVLKDWEAAWREKGPLFADTLNRLAGFRLTDQKAHDIDDFLEPPLKQNRMQKETLMSMWETVAQNKKPLLKFMARKAELLGLEKLTYADLVAPVTVGDFEAKKYSWEEAQHFIIDNFQDFSPKMAELAQTAFDKNWIEAEDRPGKRPGGYCSDLPESEESRIFMTFSGSSNEVSTLAHELGHAFHSHVMRDLPYLNTNYAMNVAETASTFAELVVSDATVKAATSEEEKINLLNDQLSRAVSMFMDIHSRFLFEYRFYEERKVGYVPYERLNELMLEAQKEAYGDSLSVYHPTFWASKLHFYGTSVPFYNFPYTFGFLFSTGIYAQSLERETGFEDDYIALLRDTGSMTTEELAEKHLGVDLTQADFWQQAIDQTYEDIDTFMELTEKYV